MSLPLTAVEVTPVKSGFAGVQACLRMVLAGRRGRGRWPRVAAHPAATGAIGTVADDLNADPPALRTVEEVPNDHPKETSMTSPHACHARAAVPRVRDAADRFVDRLDEALDLIEADRPRSTLEVTVRACDHHASEADAGRCGNGNGTEGG